MAREQKERKEGAAEFDLGGANVVRWQISCRARTGYEVILIDAVATDAEASHQHPILIYGVLPGNSVRPFPVGNS